MARYVTVQVQLVQTESEKAFLFVVDSKDVWVPKSTIDDPDEVTVGDRGIEVNVADWFCRKADIHYT